MDEEIEDLKEHAWREVAAVDAAYARGELDDDGWQRAMAALVVPKYLGAATLQGGSGHSGSAEDWEWSRGIVAEAIDRSGTFLDIGCANGLLMESVARWGAASGLAIEPYGIDIVPEFVNAARARLPQWADRFFVGNALGFEPPFRFDFVRTCVDYVPHARRAELIAWLLDRVVSPRGRLIIGKYNEEIGERALELEVAALGFRIAGRADRKHRDARISYRVVWIEIVT